MYIFQNWSDDGQFIRITNAINTLHLDFPFHWSNGKRAFTYRTVDSPESMIRTKTENGWHEECMDLAAFTGWMDELSNLDAELEPFHVDHAIGARWDALLEKHHLKGV